MILNKILMTKPGSTMRIDEIKDVIEEIIEYAIELIELFDKKENNEIDIEFNDIQKYLISLFMMYSEDITYWALSLRHLVDVQRGVKIADVLIAK